MFKYLVVLAVALACAMAAPQFFARSVIDNEGAKQVGLPYANGWTDGPNNGIGPVVAYGAAPVLSHVPVAHHGYSIGSPFLHGSYVL